MKRLMMMLLPALAMVAAALALPTSPVVAASAASVHGRSVDGSPSSARAGRQVCAKGSGSGSGTCWKLLKTVKHLRVVEAIPLENKTRHKKVNMHCSFSRSVSRSVEVGGEVSASATASVFKVVEVNVTATVHRNVTQTAEEASSAGGDVTLRPGESVVCQRTYGHVVARVKQYSWSGGKIVESKILRAKIPANLGVRITD